MWVKGLEHVVGMVGGRLIDATAAAGRRASLIQLCPLCGEAQAEDGAPRITANNQERCLKHTKLIAQTPIIQAFHVIPRF